MLILNDIAVFFRVQVLVQHQNIGPLRTHRPGKGSAVCHGQRPALLGGSDIVQPRCPCFAHGLLPLGHHKGVCLVWSFALASRLIQTHQRDQALLHAIRAIGVKFVLSHTVHDPQVGHELHVGHGPVCNFTLVCVGQRLCVIVNLSRIQPIGPRQHDRRLLPGDGSELVQVTIPTTL